MMIVEINLSDLFGLLGFTLQEELDTQNALFT